MSSKALRNEHGYAIEIEANELRFVSTRRSSVGMFSLIAGGLALILLVNGGVQMAMTNAVAGLVLGGLGALFGTVAVLVWKRRRPPAFKSLSSPAPSRCLEKRREAVSTRRQAPHR